MNTKYKTSLLVVVGLVISLGLGAGAAQQNNNQQAQDPNAPRGAIGGHVIEQGRGIPVKRATVNLTRIVTQAAAQPVQATQAGAVGTTANQGTALGGLVGATAGGQQGRNPGGTNNNLPNNTNNNNNGGNQGRGGGFNGNGGGNLSVQTGNDGSYIFNDVQAGEYTVTVTLDQYLTQEYGQRTLSGKGTPITLQAGERLESIDFQMIKAGVISGTVLDEDGQPMANVQVQALTFDFRNGQRSLRPIGTARATNDLGEYRLYYLEPGDYYVTARANNPNQGNRGFDIRGVIENLPADQREQVIQQLRGGRGNQGGNQGGQDFQAALQGLATNIPSLRTALDTAQAVADPVEAYAPAYYPGTMEVSQAAAVQLPPSGDIRGIDFSVRPIPTVTLSGVILQPSVVIVSRNPQPTNNNANNNNNRGNNNNNNNNNANNANNNNRNNNTAATTNNNNRQATNNNATANNNANNNNNRNNTNNNATANNNNNNANRGNNNNNNANNNNANRGNNNNNANNNNANRGNNNNNNADVVRAEIRLVPIGTSLGRGGGGRGGDPRGGGGGQRGPGGFGGVSNNPVTGRTVVNNDGTFQLTGVIPGAYNLVAVGQKEVVAVDGRQEQVQVTATQKVDVGYGGNITGLTLALRPGIRVPGQIYLDGQTPTNFQMERMRVVLELADDLPNVQSVRTNVTADGTFFIDEVVPGARYRVKMENVQGGGYVQAGRYGSENALNATIVAENEGTSLQLQMAFSPGNVQGTVLDRDKPQRGILTVLVPQDRGRIDLYKTANSGAEGKVTFSNVPPGDYKIFAWEEVKDGAWQDALYMEKFEDKGRLVHVEKAGASTETIDVIKSAAE